MRAQIARLAGVTALACALTAAPAHADGGVDDICVIITISGAVNASVGHCEPTTGTTHEFSDGIGQPGLLWVDIYLRLP